MVEVVRRGKAGLKDKAGDFLKICTLSRIYSADSKLLEFLQGSCYKAEDTTHTLEHSLYYKLSLTI